MSGTALYFITGSSGSGKTTLLRAVTERFYPGLSTHHVDDFPQPTAEEVAAEGGPAASQSLWTRRMIEALARSHPGELVVIDGQSRPTVILDAAREAGAAAVHVTLVDCGHAERRRRLLEERNQPELDILDMYAWAAYLRGQVDALGLEVLDTTPLTKDAAVRRLAESIARFAAEAGVALPRGGGTA